MGMVLPCAALLSVLQLPCCSGASCTLAAVRSGASQRPSALPQGAAGSQHHIFCCQHAAERSGHVVLHWCWQRWLSPTPACVAPLPQVICELLAPHFQQYFEPGGDSVLPPLRLAEAVVLQVGSGGQLQGWAALAAHTHLSICHQR